MEAKGDEIFSWTWKYAGSDQANWHLVWGGNDHSRQYAQGIILIFFAASDFGSTVRADREMPYKQLFFPCLSSSVTSKGR